MFEDERIVKLRVGSRVRIWARVQDAVEGAQWIQETLTELRFDVRSVEFGLELGSLDDPRSEVWVEGRTAKSSSQPADHLKFVG